MQKTTRLWRICWSHLVEYLNLLCKVVPESNKFIFASFALALVADFAQGNLCQKMNMNSWIVSYLNFFYCVSSPLPFPKTQIPSKDEYHLDSWKVISQPKLINTGMSLTRCFGGSFYDLCQNFLIAAHYFCYNLQIELLTQRKMSRTWALVLQFLICIENEENTQIFLPFQTV